MKFRAPTRQLLAALTVMTLLLGAVAVPAAGAGQTGVRLVADTDEVPVDGTTTVAVVVTDVDGGVGAYNVTVSLDTEHARITNASAAGGTGFERNLIADDGSSVRMVAALLNTTDTGSATIATVTIEGTAAGRSDLTLDVGELGDEQGATYKVGDTTGVSLSVTAPSSTATAESTATASSEAESETTSAESGADNRGPVAAFGPIERIQRSVPLPVVGGIVLVGAVALGVFIGRRH